MSGPMRIKGYDEIIEALREAETVAGHLSDFCVRTLEEAERLERIERAARSLIDCPDFWKNAGTLPGEYDNLVDALAPRSERREGEPDDCPDCNDGILTRAFAEPHDIPCPTCNGTMLAPPAAPKEEP